MPYLINTPARYQEKIGGLTQSLKWLLAGQVSNEQILVGFSGLHLMECYRQLSEQMYKPRQTASRQWQYRVRKLNSKLPQRTVRG